MGTDQTFTFLKAFLAARMERLRDVRNDRGAMSIEAMMIIGGLVVVGGIAVTVIVAKVNEKAAGIK